MPSKEAKEAFETTSKERASMIYHQPIKRHRQMSEKESNLLDGNVESVTIKKISYEEFKTLPITMQKVYISEIIKKFDVSISSIAIMMGCDPKSLLQYLYRRGIKNISKKGTSLAKEGNAKKFFLEMGVETTKKLTCGKEVNNKENNESVQAVEYGAIPTEMKFICDAKNIADIQKVISALGFTGEIEIVVRAL